MILFRWRQLNVISNEQFASETLEEITIIPRSLKKAVPRVICVIPSDCDTNQSVRGFIIEHLNRVNKVNL